MVEPSQPMEYLAEKKLGNTTRAVRTLHRLQQVVHNAFVINYYEEESQAIEKVLSIFISCHQPTSQSWNGILAPDMVVVFQNILDRLETKEAACNVGTPAIALAIAAGAAEHVLEFMYRK